MKYLVVVASILAIAAADTPVTGNWALYCGSSCNGASQVASGTLTSGNLCASLSSPYAYCRLEGDDFFRATLSPEADCGTSAVTISPGDCTNSGNWLSHTITAML
ncbi:hypothetical protein PISL3812_06662 [Talaromyces islandicus]|uniref:Uncharacterized protein n=1 Tax=Talaromyces islandicus TaxID=28573 RepID=A0A0U1M217_TALIS|nr:hypothetical protein PISL3812_06662 [Talaromyces islandicus]